MCPCAFLPPNSSFFIPSLLPLGEGGAKCRVRVATHYLIRPSVLSAPSVVNPSQILSILYIHVQFPIPHQELFQSKSPNGAVVVET